MKNNKEKIAVILPNLNNGGAERSHIYIANEWIKLGYQVVFVLMEKKGNLIPLISKEIQIINLKQNRLRNIIFPLTKLLYQNKFDIIVAPMWPITIISTISWYLSLKKGKLFLVDHNPIIKKWANDFNLSWSLVKFSIKLTYNRVSGIIPVSSGIKDDILKIIVIKKHKLQVIYNPINNNSIHYKKSQNEKIKLFGNLKYNVVSTGSLKKSKDYITLINAVNFLINKNIEINLNIIGEGKEKENLDKLIKKNNLSRNIKLLGYIEDPFPYLVNADLYVNSSIYDGLPLSMIEALVSRIPIVSTDCESGPREILKNGKYGRLVPVNDYKSLAYEIENVLIKKTSIEKVTEEDMLLYDSKEISKKYINFFFNKLN